MQTRQQHQQRADLVILGGGYAAVNALEAASFHLPEGARVFVVAREAGWGGQWVEQYEFVRLHQPYRAFTAGKREWDLGRIPASRLDLCVRRAGVVTRKKRLSVRGW